MNLQTTPLVSLCLSASCALGLARSKTVARRLRPACGRNPLALLWLLTLAAALVTAPPAVRGQTLAQALNATNLTWTTSGFYGGWSAQTTTTHDGVSAADSGRVTSIATSTLQTTVTGPGTLSFWWSNPSSENQLTFSANGTTLSSILLYRTWQQQTFYLGAGTQALKWVYAVFLAPGDNSHGYVDEVSWTPGATAPLITSQPAAQSQVAGLDTAFNVAAGGTPPLYYQWQFGGTDIPGATRSAYTVTNVQSTNLGLYSVMVTNSIGSITSSCAPLVFGQVAAWGASAYGATATALGATNVLATAAGNYFNLWLSADGTVSGWGWSVNGVTNYPTDLTNAIAISVGYSHCLALRSDGTVTAWGGQNHGETNVPAGLGNVVAIAGGPTSYSVALRADGTLAAWGWGYLGETNVPADLTNVVAIAAGYGYVLALKADGTVTTWGNSAPAVPAGLTNIIAVAAGQGYDLALLADETVVAWGQNAYGQATVPAGLTNAVAIAAGNSDSMALRADGTVIAWGYNGNGATNVPSALTNVVAISAGAYHNLARVGTSPLILATPVAQLAKSVSSFSLVVPSQSGRVYALEYKDNLSDANWTSLPLTAGTGTDLVLLDPTANDSQRFYRVRRW
jgi:hypothetical protein